MEWTASFNGSTVLNGGAASFAGQGLMLVKSATGVELDVLSEGSTHTVSVDRSHSALIVRCGAMKISSRGGEWSFHPVSLPGAVKLLAFLEAARELGDSDRCNCASASTCAVIEVPGDLTICNFDRWLITRVVDVPREANLLLAFLRSQEGYGLVRFLLREHTRLQTVSALAERYGVSEGYFRRLCRQALGRGLKSELRQWRAVRAVLQIVGNDENLTEIAMNNGFSSPSHFSREVRVLFGISPRQLRRAV